MKHTLEIVAAVSLAAGVFLLVNADSDSTSPVTPPPLDSSSSSSSSSPTAPGQDVLGQKAPDFELETTHGEKVRLSELEGKVVVLDFWAVWCGPCRESMPFFEKLQKDHAKDGLVVVGLHVDDRMPSLDEVNAYLTEVGASYRNLVSTTDVDNAFDIVAMPTTYLVDRKGVLTKRHIGFNPARTPDRLLKDVEALLAE